MCTSSSSRQRFEGFASPRGGRRSLRLPSRLVPELEDESRTTAHDLLRLYGAREERLEFGLPPGWKGAAGADTSASADGAYLAWTDSRKVENGKLTFVRTVRVKKPVLAAADQPAYLAEQSAMLRIFDRPVEFRLEP